MQNIKNFVGIPQGQSNLDQGGQRHLIKRFKDQIEQALRQKISPKPHGGDRKSKTYRENLKGALIK